MMSLWSPCDVCFGLCKALAKCRAKPLEALSKQAEPTDHQARVNHAMWAVRPEDHTMVRSLTWLILMDDFNIYSSGFGLDSNWFQLLLKFGNHMGKHVANFGIPGYLCNLTINLYWDLSETNLFGRSVARLGRWSCRHRTADAEWFPSERPVVAEASREIPMKSPCFLEKWWNPWGR